MAKKVSKRVKTLNGFMKWAEQFNDGQYLFRGVSKHTYKIEASAYRRLLETDRSNPTRLLKINRELIDKARLLGHDQKDGRYLSDLELLAELQHFGAATCLIDFTRSAQIALWFACQQSSSGAANGKVFAVRSNDPVLFRTITPKLVTEEDIESFFQEDERGSCPLYQWQPKQWNNRVIAQQSVFIFGGSEIVEEAACVILKNSKSEILDSLNSSAGITEASIYPDFDGFARLHAQNRPHIQPDIQGYLQRGIIAQMENKPDEAITYYSEVISLQPDTSTLAIVYQGRGFAHFFKREFASAVEDFTKAIEYNSNDAVTYYSRGTAYSLIREFDLAIKDYSEAIELKPEFSEVYVHRGAAYVGNNEVDLALKDYNKAVELKPDDPATYVRRGIAYGRKREIDTALKDFAKAIELNPGLAEAYSTRGAAYIDKNEIDLAISDCTKAIELAPNDAEVYCCRGRAYNEQGNFNKAIDDLTQAIELDPHLAEAYLNRGNAYDHQEDFNKAIGDYTKAIELDPDDTDFYCYRGFAYQRKGDLNLAIDDFTEAIKRNPNFAEAYLDRGCIYGEIRDFDKAINDFTKLVQLRPNDSKAYTARGVTYRKKGNFNLAINDFSRAIKADPDDAQAYYHRADLLLHLGEFKKAKSDLTTARDIGINIIDAFHNSYESIENFEQKAGIQLPEDIAVLLTQSTDKEDE